MYIKIKLPILVVHCNYSPNDFVCNVSILLTKKKNIDLEN